MNLIQHLLLSVTLSILVYLLVQNQQMQTELTAIHTLQQDTVEIVAKNLKPLTEKLEVIHTVTNQFGKDATEANHKKLTTLQKRLDLYKTLSVLRQSDLLRAEGKGGEAADKLLSTKKTIWDAGEVFADKKVRLQSLMGAIDSLANGWKSGGTNLGTDVVRKEIEIVLGELGND